MLIDSRLIQGPDLYTRGPPLPNHTIFRNLFYTVWFFCYTFAKLFSRS